jgi:hypothetical protein
LYATRVAAVVDPQPHAGQVRNDSLRRIPSTIAKSASDSFDVFVGFTVATMPSGVRLREVHEPSAQTSGDDRPARGPSMNHTRLHSAGLQENDYRALACSPNDACVNCIAATFSGYRVACDPTTKHCRAIALLPDGGDRPF